MQVRSWCIMIHMFDLKTTIAIVAALLAFIGNISYLRDSVRGSVKPHPYTWLIWSIVSMTTFFGGIAKGAGIGALPTGVAEGFTIIIFLLSFKYFIQGKSAKIRPLDHVFFVVALLGLIPWYITKDPTISVVIVVAIDLLAFVPTLRKTYLAPQTEKPMLYRMNVLRHLLTLFSLGAYNIATMLHSVAMIVINTVMVLLIQRRKK